MRRAIGLATLTLMVVTGGRALARDVACGEACDAKMNQCVAKCPEPPPGPEDPKKDPHLACWNECAEQTFHPCLDACKFPKPSWATD